MTNGRPKKRGRPRKIVDYAPKRVIPVKKKWYQKVWGWIKPKEEVRVIKNEADQFLYDTEIFYKRVLRMCLQYFSMGAILAVLFVFALGEPTFISPVNSERGMERGYRIVPISHPEVAYAKEEVEKPKVDAPVDVAEIVRKYFGDIADEALTCFKSESGLRPTAINYSNRNGTWDIGLAQVNTIHCGKVGATNREDCKNKLLDLETNVRIAKQIYDGRGFNAWYGRTCKQFWK